MSLVSHTVVANVSTSTTPDIDTTGSTLLIVSLSSLGGISQPTLSDSKGNTFIGLTLQEFPSYVINRLFYVANPIVGSNHNFTFTGSGVYCTLCAAGFNNIQISSPFDGHENGGISNTNIVNTGSITPANNGSLIVSGFGHYLFSNDSIDPTIDSGLTIIDSTLSDSSTRSGGALAYVIQSGLSTLNPQWVASSGTDPTAATIASFISIGGSTIHKRLLLGVG